MIDKHGHAFVFSRGEKKQLQQKHLKQTEPMHPQFIRLANLASESNLHPYAFNNTSS